MTLTPWYRYHKIMLTFLIAIYAVTPVIDTWIPFNKNPRISYSVSAASVSVTKGTTYQATLTVSDRDTWKNIATGATAVWDNAECEVQPHEILGGTTVIWSYSGYQNNVHTFVHTKLAYTHWQGQPITSPVYTTDTNAAVDTQDEAIYGAVHDHVDNGYGWFPFYFSQGVTINP